MEYIILNQWCIQGELWGYNLPPPRNFLDHFIYFVSHITHDKYILNTTVYYDNCGTSVLFKNFKYLLNYFIFLGI